MGGNKTQQKQRGRPQGGRERRAAGQARTGAFEGEGEALPASALDATTLGKGRVTLDPQEEEESEEEEGEDEKDVKHASSKDEAHNGKPAGGQSIGSEWKQPDWSSSGENEEELLEIEAQIKHQLQEWASDATMPLDEQKRHVRQLLAQWHPDKNQHCHTAATRIFQFIQAEVNRIIAELSEVASKVAQKEAGIREQRAIRQAEKSAMASAQKAAREAKQRQKGVVNGNAESIAPEVARDDGPAEETEWSLVVGHGPATTEFLRPWPRSHFSLQITPLAVRGSEILLFGGEAYDGREVTFYSDLYRLDIANLDSSRTLPWEKLYSAAPFLEGPEPRSSHQVVVWDRYLYLFGGEWSSRDQRRYRQFDDLWRLDVAQRARWERLCAEGAPCPRSGHRMASSPSGHAVVYGGFSEDKRRRITYLDDMHMLDLSSSTWTSAGSTSRNSRRPGKRAACLLWAVENAVCLYGGTRPKAKGSEKLEVFSDLWRGAIEPSASGSAWNVSWEVVTPSGEGPGKRTGLCHCSVSAATPHRRLVFGGVHDLHRLSAEGKRETELALFHNDLFFLDCAVDGSQPQWFRLWPAPGSSLAAPLDLALLPKDVSTRGGGADVSSLVPLGQNSRNQVPAPQVPRGRMAGGCFVHDGAFWIFGGSCESGPKQEVTLDDFWRLPLAITPEKVSCEPGAGWECILALSERATVWFDSDSEDDEEDDDDPAGPATSEALVPASAALAAKSGGGTLSKRAMKEEAKKVRVEAKQQKMLEKCDEKLSRRDAKREKQRALAKDGEGA